MPNKCSLSMHHGNVKILRMLCYLCFKKGGCKLISTPSQFLCMSPEASKDPQMPTQILVSSFHRLHDCAVALGFDWRKNDLPLDQTLLINSFHTTNIPCFCPWHIQPAFDFIFLHGIRAMCSEECWCNNFYFYVKFYRASSPHFKTAFLYLYYFLNFD